MHVDRIALHRGIAQHPSVVEKRESSGAYERRQLELLQCGGPQEWPYILRIADLLHAIGQIRVRGNCPPSCPQCEDQTGKDGGRASGAFFCGRIFDPQRKNKNRQSENARAEADVTSAAARGEGARNAGQRSEKQEHAPPLAHAPEQGVGRGKQCAHLDKACIVFRRNEKSAHPSRPHSRPPLREGQGHPAVLAEKLHRRRHELQDAQRYDKPEKDFAVMRPGQHEGEEQIDGQ